MSMATSTIANPSWGFGPAPERHHTSALKICDKYVASKSKRLLPKLLQQHKIPGESCRHPAVDKRSCRKCIISSFVMTNGC